MESNTTSFLLRSSNETVQIETGEVLVPCTNTARSLRVTQGGLDVDVAAVRSASEGDRRFVMDLPEPFAEQLRAPVGRRFSSMWPAAVSVSE